jgi:hypothetical protein
MPRFTPANHLQVCTHAAKGVKLVSNEDIPFNRQKGFDIRFLSVNPKHRDNFEFYITRCNTIVAMEPKKNVYVVISQPKILCSQCSRMEHKFPLLYFDSKYLASIYPITIKRNALEVSTFAAQKRNQYCC